LTTARNTEKFKAIGQRSMSQDLIFGFSPLRDRAKKFVDMITDETLDLAG